MLPLQNVEAVDVARLTMDPSAKCTMQSMQIGSACVLGLYPNESTIKVGFPNMLHKAYPNGRHPGILLKNHRRRNPSEPLIRNKACDACQVIHNIQLQQTEN